MSFADKIFFRRSHACPPWLCFTFDHPLRKLIHDPAKVLGLHVKAGDTVLDLGPGRGYFTMELARRVGPTGRVIAADIHPGMLSALVRRARRHGVVDRIRPHLCPPDSLALDHSLDFVLMFWMLHETPDPGRIFREIRIILRPEGRILFVEPKLHVSGPSFEAFLTAARNAGFDIAGRPAVRMSRAALLSGR